MNRALNMSLSFLSYRWNILIPVVLRLCVCIFKLLSIRTMPLLDLSSKNLQTLIFVGVSADPEMILESEFVDKQIGLHFLLQQISFRPVIC
jgi:hypothetical protein